ncbi:MAG: hypothetical protein ABJG68_04665 [Crocinitomicaceae bacterium]
MFGLEDIMKKVDLGDIMSKFNLGESEKEEVTKQAADAVQYRANKEKSRGNEGIMENLFSAKDNSEDANTVQKKLEGDLEYNLKNKTNMEPSMIEKIKSEVMSRFLGGATNAAKESGDAEGKGLMSMFSGGSDMMKNIGDSDIGKKIKGFF